MNYKNFTPYDILNEYVFIFPFDVIIIVYYIILLFVILLLVSLVLILRSNLYFLSYHDCLSFIEQTGTWHDPIRNITYSRYRCKVCGSIRIGATRSN